MKAKVTEEGVWIPKSLLDGATEVEMHREGSALVIVPVLEHDPIWDLGKDPIMDDGNLEGNLETQTQGSDRLDRLEAENQRLSARLRELERRSLAPRRGLVQAEPLGSHPAARDHGVEDEDEAVSRRHLLRNLGGAAVAGKAGCRSTTGH